VRLGPTTPLFAALSALAAVGSVSAFAAGVPVPGVAAAVIALWLAGMAVGKR